MGFILSQTFLGSWHAIWIACSCFQFFKSWAIFYQRGKLSLLTTLKPITYSLQRLFQHAVASLLASTAGGGGSSAVLNFAVQRVSWVSRSSTSLKTHSNPFSFITIPMWRQLQLSLPLSRPHALGEWARLSLLLTNVHLAHLSWQIWTRRTFTPTYGLSLWNGILGGQSVEYILVRKSLTLFH